MTDQSENILQSLDAESGVLTLTVNNPARYNALDVRTLDALEASIIQAVAWPEVRGIILTGSGTKAFVAGADIGEFIAVSATGAQEFSRRGQFVVSLLERSPKPVVAAVNGYALGGGCEVAMACHLRIASDTARFGQPEVNLGMNPGYGGTQRLIQLVGKGKAMEMMLTGDPISAHEALRIGLVNHVVTQNELLPVANTLLRKILSRAPIAVSMVIESVNAYFAGSAYDAEARAFSTSCHSEDFREGTSAFMEKRTPVFKGR